MSSTWGNRVRISIYGESHGPVVGVVLDGIRAGEKIVEQDLQQFMKRRVSLDPSVSTHRQEEDKPELLSGLKKLGEGMYVTTGAPIHVLIRNGNVRSEDYGSMVGLCRPGHGDFTGAVKYGGWNETVGGGHFSGRLTAPLTAAGGICKQILDHQGIRVFSHILSINDVRDVPFDPVSVGNQEADLLEGKQFAVLEESSEEPMRRRIREAAVNRNSVGGVVECAAIHLPVGLGDPMFDGMENRISSILFAIPGIKGVEFGNGFACAQLEGSENNDGFYRDDQGNVRTVTNRHGGILGGITSGMPLVFRVVMKPTPTIGIPQNTVNLSNGTECIIKGKGRHDPCIVVRGTVCVEAAASIAILDALLEHKEEEGLVKSYGSR